MTSLCLTFLYPAVGVSLPPSPILSLPLFPLTATALLSVSVSLFLFCWFVYFMSHRWKHAARVFRWLTVTWARGRTLRRGLVETLLLEVKGEEGKHKAGEGLAPSRGKPQVTRGWKGRKPSAASRRALWVRGWGSHLRQRPAFRVLCVATKADL